MTDAAASTATAVDRTKAVETIASALAEVLGHDLPDLTEDSRLFDQVGLDSSGVFELLMALEEAFSIELDTDNLEMSHFESVRTLADFLLGEMGA
ncbi:MULTISPECIES: acyl carrier protein [Streptomyces]|uniref:Acyl carrier protein n=1 Tax=Streptomyces lycii TaxID=2654337 RepID=A0ABQ7FG15_9ACTN|nr:MULTISPECIES: acyl carrier protein [Streptomyces]KAF4406776.1 acyl carrier protein [Streptomyces lycii]PGH49851.1 acyl carrier protein [Streptomyces sp. Ru87]